MNWLPDSLNLAFAETENPLVDLVVCSGANLRVEADSSFVTTDSIGLTGVVIVPVSGHGIQVAAIRPGAARPYHVGGNNTDAATIGLLAASTDTCRLVVFHRRQGGEVTRLEYAPVFMDSGGTASLNVAQDSTVFTLRVDENGDGQVDWLFYPGGAVVSVPWPGTTPDVPTAAPLAFALDPVRPNPSRGGTLTVHFSLPSDAPARLELLDVAGRRIASRDVGAGQHTLDLGAGQHLAPGLYLVRLTQGANTRTTRVAVLK